MEVIDHLLGLHEQKLEWYQMSIRAVFIFLIALAYIRVAGMRTFGKKSAVDLVVALMLGALLGKSIIGPEPFFPIVAAAFVLVALHRFFAWLAYKSLWMEKLIKGNPILVIKDGKCLTHNLAQKNMTERELFEAMRINGNVNKIQDVKEAYFEMNGEISIVRKDK